MSRRFRKEYEFWRDSNEDVADRLVRIIDEIVADPLNPGIGKAERLRHALRGYCSRRLTEKDRIIYRVTKDAIEFVSCRYHE